MRKNLRNLRLNLNLTQREIAEKLGISLRQYQRIEQGKQNGTVNTLLKLKKLLNKPIDFLLEQED